MALNKGKRKRRERHRHEGDYYPQVVNAPAVEKATPTRARSRRTVKPLSQRSPIVPAVFSGICFVGAVFTLFVYQNRVAHHVRNHPVTYTYSGPSSLAIGLAVLYSVLGVVEAFIAYRIYKARGSWR